MSSPSAILWFAAVGGTLIARSGGGGPLSSALFLGGFLCAGLLWSAGLCFAASHGGKLLGDKLLRYSYMASAAIFCYFAVYVIVSGYNEFVGAGPPTSCTPVIAKRVWLLYSQPNPFFLPGVESWMSKNASKCWNLASNTDTSC
jgi:hypothetical protein